MINVILPIFSLFTANASWKFLFTYYNTGSVLYVC